MASMLLGVMLGSVLVIGILALVVYTASPFVSSTLVVLYTVTLLAIPSALLVSVVDEVGPVEYFVHAMCSVAAWTLVIWSLYWACVTEEALRKARRERKARTPEQRRASYCDIAMVIISAVAFFGIEGVQRVSPSTQMEAVALTGIVSVVLLVIFCVSLFRIARFELTAARSHILLLGVTPLLIIFATQAAATAQPPLFFVIVEAVFAAACGIVFAVALWRCVTNPKSCCCRRAQQTQ